MYETILELLDVGGETRNIEFKKTYDWADPQHKAKIVKCILSMSNTKDGGYLVLGIDDSKTQREEKLCGMDLEHYARMNHDHVIVQVNKFADPPISFQMHPVEVNEKHFILFKIPEFDEIPIVCKQSGEQGLKEGALFSRSKSKPESAIIRTQSEMRELIDTAINKGIRSFYSRINETGLQVIDESSSQSYNLELNGIENNDIFNAINNEGYWKVNIKPTSYSENRIDSLQKCEEILRRSKVSIRGWDFPHISRLIPAQKFIQSTEDFGSHKEFFRFFSSGQFIFYKKMAEDADSSYHQRVSGKGLEIFTTLFFFTEIFEFASRIFTFEEMGNHVTIELEAFDVKGRQLFFFDPFRSLNTSYTSQIDDVIKISRQINIENLISEKHELAIEVSQELFAVFGLNSKTDIFETVLKEQQERLLTRTL